MCYIWQVITLAIWLSGYLAIWLSGYLAIWLTQRLLRSLGQGHPIRFFPGACPQLIKVK
ncbi:hypothetical protein O0544_16790 [Edwardsiella anguillarum]|nr:hypothetical protein [Edwardsiella anguillarum]